MVGIDVERLVAAVIESGMGEVQICTLAGVGHQTLAKMLNGQMVRFPSVGRICKTLSITPAEIIKEIKSDEAVQTEGKSILASPTGKSAHKPPHDTKGLRDGTARRVPS